MAHTQALSETNITPPPIFRCGRTLKQENLMTFAWSAATADPTDLFLVSGCTLRHWSITMAILSSDTRLETATSANYRVSVKSLTHLPAPFSVDLQVSHSSYAWTKTIFTRFLPVKRCSRSLFCMPTARHLLFQAKISVPRPEQPYRIGSKDALPARSFLAMTAHPMRLIR